MHTHKSGYFVAYNCLHSITCFIFAKTRHFQSLILFASTRHANFAVMHCMGVQLLPFSVRYKKITGLCVTGLVCSFLFLLSVALNILHLKLNSLYWSV